MSHDHLTTLESFHRFLGKQLESEVAIGMSPEKALALWREEQETLTAIREGVDDVLAGRTTSLEEFNKDFCQRHGIADQA